MMNVLVFAKQIPDVNKIEFDPATMRIRRENVELTMNSFDRKAIEEALKIKEKHGGTVSVATMGPPSANEMLKEAILMGADHGYLITDRRYAGADTLVTSRILAKFASTLNSDIILMGKYSLDGETSQVPPEVAEFLRLPFKSSVSAIRLDDGAAVVEAESEDGLADYRISLPAVFSVSEKINRARAPSREAIDFQGRITAVGDEQLHAGVAGHDSPTVVMDTVKIESFRKVKFLSLDSNSMGIIRGLIEAVPEEEEKAEMNPFDGEAAKQIWGIALNDRDVSFEIATKISALSLENRLGVKMIGNIEPSHLEGMPARHYVFISSMENGPFTDALTELITKEKPEYIVFPSTVDGREVSATIAARLGLGLTADCIDLHISEGKLIQHKPAFGGGVVARIVTRSSPQMATVRPGIFMKQRSGRQFSVSRIEVQTPEQSRRLSFKEVPATFRPVTSSKVIVGIGRGIGGRENMPEIMEFAAMLGAAVGGTRPIVDAGYVPRQQQIGLTGYSVSPDVYLALGISGRDNHVVGIRYAKKVIAVNKSADAPIFRFADYGLVGDVFEFMRKYREYTSAGKAQ